jgi:hypothetical protein
MTTILEAPPSAPETTISVTSSLDLPPSLQWRIARTPDGEQDFILDGNGHTICSQLVASDQSAHNAKMQLLVAAPVLLATFCIQYTGDDNSPLHDLLAELLQRNGGDSSQFLAAARRKYSATPQGT